MKISVKKILEDMPKDLTDIEKVRYIYLSVGDIFSYDRDYIYLGREREILAEYSKEMSIDDIEKREYYNMILAVCSQMSLIESETINRLKKANINARIVGYDEEKEGHVAVITDIDGKNYYLDIALDLYRIQKGMKTKGFAKATEAIDGTKCEVISDEEIKKIDEKIGYCKNNMYMEDIIEMIKKEMQDDDSWNEYIKKYVTSENKDKEEIIIKCKIDFIFKYMKNNISEKEKMGMVELKKYYRKLFQILLTDKEKSSIKIGDYDVFFMDDEGKKEDSELYEVKIKNNKYYYLYDEQEKGFKETDVEKIINDIEEGKMKYCDSYFKPKFDKDEGR